MAATADSDSCLKSRPPSHIVLPKHGALVPVAEPLPSQKDDLELVIVRKFVRAVGERFGRTLSAPTRGDRWPDFWTAEGADQVGIEVAEVVNPDHIAAKGYGVPQPVSVEVARRLLLGTIENRRLRNTIRSQRTGTSGFRCTTSREPCPPRMPWLRRKRSGTSTTRSQRSG